ncbi:MAG: HEPN domain-containing protein [Candidatus Firestonebacteria bacterium]|nr:HEPN domain-containing protein [Candidatus Firestonebacteria bacterium]
MQDYYDSVPNINNLIKLAKNIKLSLTYEQKQLLVGITRFNIAARYPDFKQEFYKTCTKEFTEEYFFKIKELYKWLLLQMKL